MENVERVEVAVLSYGRPLGPRLQIAEGEVVGRPLAMNARYRRAGQRSPDRFLVSDAAAVYVIVLYVEIVVLVLGRGDGFAVHSREAAPAVYSAPDPAADVAAESHEKT